MDNELFEAIMELKKKDALRIAKDTKYYLEKTRSQLQSFVRGNIRGR